MCDLLSLSLSLSLSLYLSPSLCLFRSPTHRMKKVCFKTLVDEVQELEALSKDPGAVVHGKRYVSALICQRSHYP